MPSGAGWPAPGESAPLFTLRNHYGEPVELESLRGQPVILMFYPFAFSSVCGAELAEIYQRWNEVLASGARLLAVSCDSMHTLRAYAEQLARSGRAPADSSAQPASSGSDRPEEVGFDLLSDFWPHGAVTRSYGVLDDQRGAPHRVSFVLDGDLMVAHVVSAELHAARSLDQVLALVRSLRRGPGAPD